jgi:hypothetical protein
MRDDGNGQAPRVLTFSEILGFLTAGGLFLGADSLVWLLKEVRNGRELPDTVGLDVLQWNKYARDTKRAVISGLAAIGGCRFVWKKEGYRSIIAQWLAGVEVTRKLSPGEVENLKSKPLRFWPRKIRRWVRMTQFFYRAVPILRHEASQSKDEEMNGNEEEKLVRLFSRRVGKAIDNEPFATLVPVRTIALCWVITNQFPSQLLRRIRTEGDLRALEDLLRIDHRLFFDPGIQQRMRREISNPKSAFVRVALRAVKSKPPPLKEKAMKARLAAIVQMISPNTDLFQEPGIRKLYDILAVADSDGKELRDRSLPISSESFQKAIGRERGKLAEQMKKGLGGQK